MNDRELPNAAARWGASLMTRVYTVSEAGSSPRRLAATGATAHDRPSEAGHPENPDSNAPSYATLPNGYEPLNPTQPSPIYAAATAIPGDNVVRYLERKRGHALNLLSISGGGQNGAFGAGFLIGWRESGRRPQFDIVGGVSTGALLATHAFSALLPTMRCWRRCTRKSRKTISIRIEGSSAFYRPIH